MDLAAVAKAVGQILAAAKDIDGRFRLGGFTYLTATDRKAIADGLKVIGDTDVGSLILQRITGVPVPAPNVPPLDSTAPLVATGVSPMQVTTTRVDVTCDPGYDPLVSGYASGMRRSQLVRSPGGNIGSPILSGGSGLSVELTWVNIGATSGTAHSGTSPNYSLSITNGGIYDSPKAFLFGYVPISGDFSITCKLNSFTSADGFSNFALLWTDSLDPNCKFVAFETFPPASGNGENLEWCLTTAGMGSQGSRIPSSITPRWKQFTRVGNQWTGSGSSAGNGWSPISSQTLALPASGYLGIAIARNGSGAGPSATVQQLAIQQLASLTFSDTTVTAPNTYGYTVIHEDNAGNFSTANAAASVTVAAAPTTEPFPRIAALGLGNYNWGSSTAKRDYFSKCRSMWGDWFAGSNTDPTQGGAFGTWNALLADIKARSVARGGWLATHPTKIYKYCIAEAIWKILGNNRFVGQQAFANAQNMILRQQYSAGAQIDSWYGNYQWAMNASSGCHRALSNGVMVNWAEYTMQQELLQLVVDGTQVGGPVTNCDGIGYDNFFFRPRVSNYVGVNGDFDENGSNVGETDDVAAQIYRNGLAGGIGFGRAYTGFGSRAMGGNPDWATPQYPYDQLLDFHVFEAAAGESWSVESGGWLNMMNDALSKYNSLRPSGDRRLLFCFVFYGTSGSATVYSAAQVLDPLYYLASALLLDVDCNIMDQNQGGYGGTFWMDAFDLNLGNRVGVAGFNNNLSPQKATFDNAYSICWPRGGGTTGVVAPFDLWVPRGNAAGWLTPGAKINAGATITPPADRRGIVLMRAPT